MSKNPKVNFRKVQATHALEAKPNQLTVDSIRRRNACYLHAFDQFYLTTVGLAVLSRVSDYCVGTATGPSARRVRARR